jgi:hypothetical protein
VLLIEDDSPNVTADLWSGRGSAIPFNAKYLPWFFRRGDSTRVVRIVIREKRDAGKKLNVKRQKVLKFSIPLPL